VAGAVDSAGEEGVPEVAAPAVDGETRSTISMKAREFEKQLDDNAVTAAIREAEAGTSGEIRVFIASGEPAEVLAAAQREFDRLGMNRTPLRNGVLLYFAPEIQRFAVIGDEGIHFRCGPGFWEAVARDMETQLKAGRFQDAVIAGIRSAGVELCRHFPKHPGDRNDLPDGIVRG